MVVAHSASPALSLCLLLLLAPRARAQSPHFPVFCQADGFCHVPGLPTECTSDSDCRTPWYDSYCQSGECSRRFWILFMALFLLL
jgi:hypothetical protein